MSRYIGAQDGIDARQAQWSAELPDVDTRGMAVLGRARWATMAVRPVIEGVFARYGLDSGEFDVIATLLRSGPPYRLRPTELYRSLMISSGGLTDRLNRLVSSGKIRRTPAPEDARSLLVELTAEGRSVAERAFREDMEIEASLLSALTTPEQEQLAGLLRKLVLHLEGCGSRPDIQGPSQ